ncbi:MAG TPA: ATPase, T2SS/T4P/T4SS family [Negativicutes bacterium]|nr:ATPase, T2SS/T4P/T4SS family [Negativicutes bacterium]
MSTKQNQRLGEILVELGLINRYQLEAALDVQNKTRRKLGAILVELGFISSGQLTQAIEQQLGVPRVELDKIHITPEVPLIISEKLARRHKVVPIKNENGVLTVAMEDPMNIFAIDDIKLATGLRIEPVGAAPEDILRTIGLFYEKESAEKALLEFSESYESVSLGDIDEALLANVESAPVVKLLNSLIKQAIQLKASDIHIEPQESNLRIRFRQDGELREVMGIEKISHSAIVTRIKIMGGMNIAEKRVPQDGRVEMTVDGKAVDMRISVMPTVYGEKIVMRLLDRSSVLMSKHELGFSPENLRAFDSIIQNPHGIILVSGPTGSGKTTTLYAVLKELNKANRNIITIEDPVEYRINGINQSQVNVKAGMTFATGLRSILRQDPDIIMIGEIRDMETAQIAVRAAITGHLVLSTIHTNDSVSTVSRLLDMEIEPYMVSSALVGVISQRLVKRICRNCSTPYRPEAMEMKLLGIENGQPLYRGTGCEACGHTGYRGRTAIHEVLPIKSRIKEMIDAGLPAGDIKRKALELGMISLRDSCRQLVLNGVTTVEELLHMTYSMDLEE